MFNFNGWRLKLFAIGIIEQEIEGVETVISDHRCQIPTLYKLN